MSAVMMTTPNEPRPSPVAARYHLWVDGVGGYLLCLQDRVTIGGPADPGKQADVTLLANLSRKHATFVRSGEGYILEPHGTTFVGHRQIIEPTPLTGDYAVRLGSNVELAFRLPSVLSGTSVLEFASDHRPVYSVDAVIMMEDNCLMGPGRDHHVLCDGWSETVVLFRRNGEFWCKSRNPVSVAGKAARDGGPIRPGDVVSSGSDVRFRLEEVISP